MLSSWIGAYKASLFFVLMSVAARALAVPCPEPDQVASVNVHFKYEITQSDADVPILNTDVDAKIFADTSKKFTSNVQSINDIRGMDKAQFLSNIRKAVDGKTYVNFNYAGHGVRRKDESGKERFYFVLPGFKKACNGTVDIVKRELKLSEGQKEDSRTDLLTGFKIENGKKTDRLQPSTERCLKEHLVSEEELQSVFAGKHVFGLLDTCYSGGVKLSHDSAVYTATSPSQMASEEEAGGGVLSGRFASILQGKPVCPVDDDQDGEISYGEMGSALYPINILRDVQTPQASGMDKPWLKCFSLGKVPSSCRKPKSRTDFVVNNAGARLYQPQTDGKDAKSVCVVRPGERVIATGRETRDSLIEVQTMATDRCKGKTGWVESYTIRPASTENANGQAVKKEFVDENGKK